MKIVIGTDVAGFALSIKALEYLLAKNSSTIRQITWKGITYTEDNFNKYYSNMIMKNGNVYEFDDMNNKLRTHPDLIEVVEKLGTAAGERTLKIVEVPDDVKWYIDQGEDGREWVAEEHKTWW